MDHLRLSHESQQVGTLPARCDRYADCPLNWTSSPEAMHSGQYNVTGVHEVVLAVKHSMTFEDVIDKRPCVPD